MKRIVAWIVAAIIVCFLLGIEPFSSSSTGMSDRQAELDYRIGSR